jgi:hypothetical protein
MRSISRSMGDDGAAKMSGIGARRWGLICTREAWSKVARDPLRD